MHDRYPAATARVSLGGEVPGKSRAVLTQGEWEATVKTEAKKTEAATMRGACIRVGCRMGVFQKPKLGGERAQSFHA